MSTEFTHRTNDNLTVGIEWTFGMFRFREVFTVIFSAKHARYLFSVGGKKFGESS